MNNTPIYGEQNIGHMERLNIKEDGFIGDFWHENCDL